MEISKDLYILEQLFSKLEYRINFLFSIILSYRSASVTLKQAGSLFNLFLKAYIRKAIVGPISFLFKMEVFNLQDVIPD